VEVQYEMLPTHCKFDATAEKECKGRPQVWPIQLGPQLSTRV
jgi:hypothetical protein